MLEEFLNNFILSWRRGRKYLRRYRRRCVGRRDRTAVLKNLLFPKRSQNMTYFSSRIRFIKFLYMRITAFSRSVYKFSQVVLRIDTKGGDQKLLPQHFEEYLLKMGSAIKTQLIQQQRIKKSLLNFLDFLWLSCPFLRKILWNLCYWYPIFSDFVIANSGMDFGYRLALGWNSLIQYVALFDVDGSIYPFLYVVAVKLVLKCYFILAEFILLRLSPTTVLFRCIRTTFNPCSS